MGGAIVALVLVGAFLLLRPGGGGGAPTSPGASSSPGASVATGSCPTSQPPALPAGETRTVTLTTPKGTIVIKVEADLSPIAAGNFVALASCGYYDGTDFHRTATSGRHPFVIQGGDPTGTGERRPGYAIKDEPVTTTVQAGGPSRWRGRQRAGQRGLAVFHRPGRRDGAILADANTYQIIGNVTSGMDTADAISAASGGVENPADPIPVTTATVANP